ncbi:HPP family protein [Gallaecimonas pentaromativorans]|uniref:CBS domain-containing protein n=1 Tax=Gallaecimonas pentaromativorans TaxID=584787 RepID=UPI00067E8108|nr:CBS domain-containing protein [Gallaecimonas pentaromativorans]MED5525934.1 CBS domain-containing protein [Pseudomonadota bacterium]
MQTAADIMTKNLVTLPLTASLKDAHAITRDKGIRHLPVMEGEQFVGMLTQKRMMGAVINLLATYGANALERREGQTPVRELVEVDCATVTPDTPLLAVTDFFLKHRHGCLPVVDENGKLVGMLTSSDFVRLCRNLLASLA